MNGAVEREISTRTIREEMAVKPSTLLGREPCDFFVRAICLLFVLPWPASGKLGAAGLIFQSLRRLTSDD